MKNWFWLACLNGLALIAELVSLIFLVQNNQPLIPGISNYGLVLFWPLLILTFFCFIFSIAKNSNVRLLLRINAGLAAIITLNSIYFSIVLIVIIIALLVMKKSGLVIKNNIKPERILSKEERKQIVMANPALKKLNRVSIVAQSIPVILLTFSFAYSIIYAYSPPDSLKLSDIPEFLVGFCLFFLLDLLALIAFIRIDRSGNTFATIALFVNGIIFFLFFGWLIAFSVLDVSGKSLAVSTQMFKTAFWYFVPLYLIPKIVALFGSIKLHNSILMLTKGKKSAKISLE